MPRKPAQASLVPSSKGYERPRPREKAVQQQLALNASIGVAQEVAERAEWANVSPDLMAQIILAEAIFRRPKR
jgi:hypothetical protein